MTADGKAHTCLFASPESGIDLKPLLDPTADLDDLRIGLSSLWSQRCDRSSEEREGKLSLDPLRHSINSRSEMAEILISLIPLNTRIRSRRNRISAISNGDFPICI